MTDQERLKKARELALQSLLLTSQYMKLKSEESPDSTAIAMKLGQLHGELIDVLTEGQDCDLDFFKATMSASDGGWRN